MALINCPECGKEISDSSEKCINCGYPIIPVATSQKSINKKLLVSVSAIGIVILLILSVILSSCIKSSSAQICSIEGCSATVYSNSYCIDHYNELRSGTLTDTSTAADTEGFEPDEGFEEDEEVIITFTKNNTITTDSAEFTLTGYSIASKIEPSNFTGTYYHYYEAATGNVFIDVKFTIKNTATSQVTQNSVLDSVKIIYDDTYEYRCSFVTVDKDGDFEGSTSLYSIQALETMEYHLLVEVPEEIKTSAQSLICRVEVDGNIYECKLR